MCKASDLFLNRAYFKLSNSNRNLSASVPSAAIAQAIQFIKVLKHRRTNWTSGHFYECPGYEAIQFLTILKQRAEIAATLCRQFWTFVQLLVVQLANAQVPDLLTMKIKTVKISKTK